MLDSCPALFGLSFGLSHASVGGAVFGVFCCPYLLLDPSGRSSDWLTRAAMGTTTNSFSAARVLFFLELFVSIRA
ncbi:hypothetical protein ACFX19_001914 [Malus domestica]